MSADWILVDVRAMDVEVFAGEDEVVGEAALPELRVGVMGEAALDVLHGLRDVVGLEEEVDVVGHDDECEELVGAGGSVVLEGFDEKTRGGVDLETAAATERDGGDEKGASGGGSWGLGHGWIVGCGSIRARRRKGRVFDPATGSPAKMQDRKNGKAGSLTLPTSAPSISLSPSSAERG